MANDTQITAYKAFDGDLACLGHQYVVGKTYTVEGKPVLCQHGFHACENPLDVLNYYDLVGSRFARVTVSGEIDRQEDGGKLCAASITVEAELTLPEWIGAAVRWVTDACKGGGERVQAASGHSSKLAASGYYSQLAASGDYSKLAASGDYSKLAASGDYSKLAASGYYSQLAASGDYSKLAASGYYSQLAASGYYSQLEVTGADSAASAVGPGSAVKAVAGTPVAICEYDRNGKPVGFTTGVAGKDFPADTWIIVRDGKLVERDQ